VNARAAVSAAAQTRRAIRRTVAATLAEDRRMHAVTFMTEVLILGWLATLVLHLEIEHIRIRDFLIAVSGAAAGGLLAPQLGISLTGEFGLTLTGLAVSFAGAMALLAAANLVRYGRPLRERRTHPRAATAQPPGSNKD
jgi:uncharacterized membrane protein YeaQ/YmgE (transglycosylase-associated protein family)